MGKDVLVGPSGDVEQGAGGQEVETGLGEFRAPFPRQTFVQLSDGKGDEHLVRFRRGSDYSAPNLKALLSDPGRLKLYHFARFDVGILQAYLGIMAAPLYCTRTASRLVRTYTDRHGLKDLVKELLGVDLSKQQQTSDWGAPELTDAQREYAASDVRYLHVDPRRLDIEVLVDDDPVQRRHGMTRVEAWPGRSHVEVGLNLVQAARRLAPLIRVAHKDRGHLLGPGGDGAKDGLHLAAAPQPRQIEMHADHADRAIPDQQFGEDRAARLQRR